MSKKYYVAVKEVWSQLVEIEAENEKEAIEKIEDGEGNYLEEAGGLDYSYTLDKEEWTIGEDKGDPYIEHKRVSDLL